MIQPMRQSNRCNAMTGILLNRRLTAPSLGHRLPLPVAVPKDTSYPRAKAPATGFDL